MAHDLAKYEHILVEPERGRTYNSNTFAVYGYRAADRDSVLYGTTLRCYIAGRFGTVREALAAYPMAKADDGLYGMQTMYETDLYVARLPDTPDDY